MWHKSVVVLGRSFVRCRVQQLVLMCLGVGAVQSIGGTQWYRQYSVGVQTS